MPQPGTSNTANSAQNSASGPENADSGGAVFAGETANRDIGAPLCSNSAGRAANYECEAPASPSAELPSAKVTAGNPGPDPHRDYELDTCEAGALISSDGLYRYRLWRWWGDGAGGCATFVMLNPSTADGHVDDATIRKCVGFARRWKMSGIRVVNLFAFRSTDPKSLARDFAYDNTLDAMVGPENDAHLFYVLREPPGGCDEHTVIAAWGSTGGSAVAKMVRRRRVAVRKLMADLGVQPMCLGTAKDGNPRHPLMLGYDTPLVPWEPP
jgi:hypothetical protein